MHRLGQIHMVYYIGFLMHQGEALYLKQFPGFTNLLLQKYLDQHILLHLIELECNLGVSLFQVILQC